MKLLKTTPLLLLIMLFSCQKGVSFQFPTTRVNLNFTNMVGSQVLRCDTSFKTLKGETFTVTNFKYYVSNIALIDSLGNAHPVPDSYFLVDQDKPETKALHVNVDGSVFRGLRFLVGVDSIRNVSGAQTGALDPALGMFWTWNSGYIMAKLEGTSPLSLLPEKRFEYHIGGYAGTDKALRTVFLPFDHIYDTREGNSLNIELSANLLAWFTGVHDLPIHSNTACTTPGALASAYADNYATMFSITSLQVN